MGAPDAARRGGVRWILLGFGLVGASLALTAQPAQAGVTDQLVPTTTTVTKAVHHAVDQVSRAETTKAKPVVKHAIRQVKVAPVVRQRVSKPIVKIVKHPEIKRVAPLVTKVRSTVHRVVERTVHPVRNPVQKPVENLPEPIAAPVAPATPATIHVPVRSKAVVSAAGSALRSARALPVVAAVSTSPSARAMPTVALRHELAPGHRARAVVAGAESRPSAPLVPLPDPAPAPAGASSAATSTSGSASAKATLIDDARTGVDQDADRMVGVATDSWSLTRDPGFSPD